MVNGKIKGKCPHLTMSAPGYRKLYLLRIFWYVSAIKYNIKNNVIQDVIMFLIKPEGEAKNAVSGGHYCIDNRFQLTII